MIPESDTQCLTAAAREAARHAYAPYSGFAVGAAVMDERGRVFSGCNVENASYGLTVCAERHAVAAAVIGGAHRLRAVVVHTKTDPPAAPCGACRQVLHEFGGPEMEVVLANDTDRRVVHRLRDLLPEAFGNRSLGKVGEAIDDEGNAPMSE